MLTPDQLSPHTHLRLEELGFSAGSGSGRTWLCVVSDSLEIRMSVWESLQRVSGYLVQWTRDADGNRTALCSNSWPVGYTTNYEDALIACAENAVLHMNEHQFSGTTVWHSEADATPMKDRPLVMHVG